MKIWALVMGLALALLLVVCCQRPVSDAERLAHEDTMRHDDRAWSAEHDGFSGGFACHTADGGCLHMTCANRASCDYMKEAEKACATPAKDKPTVIVSDDSCKSQEAKSGSVLISSGTGWSYLDNRSDQRHDHSH